MRIRPALHCWTSVPISRKSRSQILERLDRFADDLLDARLSFDRRLLRTLADTPVQSG
jgi:hypothetical protein